MAEVVQPLRLGRDPTAAVIRKAGRQRISRKDLLLKGETLEDRFEKHLSMTMAECQRRFAAGTMDAKTMAIMLDTVQRYLMFRDRVDNRE
jgi:hypothetical protein